MATIVLDTLEYATRLKTGGFSEQQAEAQARALADVLEKQMATKAEVVEHENGLRRDIAELKRDLRETERRMEARLAETPGCQRRSGLRDGTPSRPHALAT